jgi:lipopolysaccharide export LptBFGC system permease protein LptF
MDLLIDPVIGDMQREHELAIRGGRPWRSRWILVAGYLAFSKAVALHVPIWARRTMRGWVASETGTIGGALGVAAVAMIALTVLFVAPPLLRDRVPFDGWTPWLILMLLPQSLPLTLPVVLLVGVLCGLRNRTATSRIRRGILAIGLTGSLASFSTIFWLVPAGNQAFRVTIAGREIPRGPAEMTPRLQREQALAMNAWGLPKEAGRLLVEFHLRMALGGAALVFALFGLGVAALRLGRAATAGIAIIVCALYIHYIFQLSTVSEAVFSDERVAILAAWLPNVLLILATAAFLSSRQSVLVPPSGQ